MIYVGNAGYSTILGYYKRYDSTVVDTSNVVYQVINWYLINVMFVLNLINHNKVRRLEMIHIWATGKIVW